MGRNGILPRPGIAVNPTRWREGWPLLAVVYHQTQLRYRPSLPPCQPKRPNHREEKKKQAGLWAAGIVPRYPRPRPPQHRPRSGILSLSHPSSPPPAKSSTDLPNPQPPSRPRADAVGSGLKIGGSLKKPCKADRYWSRRDLAGREEEMQKKRGCVMQTKKTPVRTPYRRNLAYYVGVASMSRRYTTSQILRNAVHARASQRESIHSSKISSIMTDGMSAEEVRLAPWGSHRAAAG